MWQWPQVQAMLPSTWSHLTLYPRRESGTQPGPTSRSTVAFPVAPSVAAKNLGELLRATKAAKLLEVEEATLAGWCEKATGPANPAARLG